MSESLEPARPGSTRPEPADPLPPIQVAVVPAGVLAQRPRLFAALGEAFGVVFHGDVPGLDGFRERPDAIIGLGEEAAGTLARLPGIPALLAAREEPRRAAQAAEVALAADPVLSGPLRGARLSEQHAGVCADWQRAGEPRILAEIAGAPVWLFAAERMTHLVATLPAELGAEEPLRERVAPGRHLALVPLVHFLREVSGRVLPSAEPVRAAFLLDDPNLRRPSYGHLRYPELAADAAEHGYHVSIAMVPRDGAVAHPRAVAAFAGARTRLSLCIHGNDHLGPEFGRVSDVPAALARAGQALARTVAFERRTGLAVDRVMVPPHERLSLPAARALAQLPFDAVCVTRPYPWLADRIEDPWLAAPPGSGPLVGFRPGQVMVPGLPTLLRLDATSSDEELALRAFLGQPIILYGHHDLLAHGLAVLRDRAAAVHRLGEVRWCSLAGIAAGASDLRLRGSALEVTMHGRRADFAAPRGVTRLRIDATALCVSDADELLLRGGDGSSARWPAGVAALRRGPLTGEVELRVLRRAAVEVPRIGSATRGAGVRRLAREARDRLSVLSRRAPDPRLAPADPTPRRRPRVLLVVENAAVPGDRRVWLEARSLHAAGLEVHVICPQGEREDERATENLREGVHIHRYPPRFAATDGVGDYIHEYVHALARTWRMSRRLARHAPFDVVHVGNPPDLLLLAARPAWRRGAARIFDHHDLVPELLTVRLGTRATRWVARLLLDLNRRAERLSYRIADVVITTNDSYAEVARTRGHVPPEDVFVVRNGPDLDRFRPVGPEPELRRGARHLFAYVGIMGPQDGVDMALQALARLAARRRDWRAVFAGIGPARRDLETLAGELGIAELVEFPGWLDDPAIAALLSSADVCLAPEPPTPFNDASTMIKVAEYMAMGRPIVAFDLRETRATAGPAALYATDVGDFAACLARLIDDPAEAEEMGARGRHRVEETLSWRTSEAHLLAAYRAALARRGRPGLPPAADPPRRRDPIPAPERTLQW